MSAIPYLYTISGFAVGLLVGMTGVGGGALMTPMLILLFGIHPAAAVGTDLLHAAATKTAGSIVHGFKGTIDWIRGQKQWGAQQRQGFGSPAKAA